MERYQISLNAIDLPSSVGLFHRPNPYAKVKIVSGPKEGTAEAQLGTTESISNCVNPDWSKIFFIDLDASEVTNLEVSIFSKADRGNDSLIGKALFEATSVFQEPGRTASEQIGRRATSR